MRTHAKIIMAFGLAASASLASGTATRAEGGCTYAAIPGTTPSSCRIAPDLVEYYGESDEGDASLQCLWRDGYPLPVVDNRFHMARITENKTGIEKILIHLDNTLVAIKNDPSSDKIAVQISNISGVISAKLCEDVDTNNFTFDGCVADYSFAPVEQIIASDSILTKKCHAFVRQLSRDETILNESYSPSQAQGRLFDLRQFIRELAY